jgi:hypothetical protein
VSGNSGAWGIAMWKDGRELAQLEGISLEGGDPIVPYLPTVPLGCLTVPPEGMGVPPVRNGDVAFAQRDGVVQFGDYYEPRQLTFRAWVCNEGCPGCSPAGALETFLLLNGVSPGRARTADKASLDITGDIDLRIHAALDDWTPAASSSLMSKSMTSGNQISWRFTVLTSGMLRVAWSANGSTVLTADSTVAPTVANGDDLWVRVTLDVDNGAAGRTITFYTSTDGVTWTQLGATVIQAGVTSIFNSTAAINIGSRDSGTLDRMAGKVYYAEVRSGINGVIVADPDFTSVGPGTTTFYDTLLNEWNVIAPAVISGIEGPPPLNARQKVVRLGEEWSRNCSGATLVLFTDCHNPSATEEEKTYAGPYLVHGRPRVNETTWQRSNRGCASVLLRFDAEDARLLLATDTDTDFPWGADHTVDVNAGASGGGNMHPNYRLDGLTMTTNGGTFTDTHLSGGGPDGGSYFNRNTVAANTSSPMTMDTTPSGTGAIPVTAATSYTLAWWAQKNVAGGPTTRVDVAWYNAGGGLISTSTGTAQAALLTWSRHTDTFVAPALAAFAKPILAWVGTALVGQALDLAQIWMNQGVAATSPAEIEIVGNLCAFLEVQLFGPLTAPITVYYGPYSFTYNDDIGPLESVTVDLRWGRASNITVDTTQDVSGNYDSPLAPGTWDFSMTTGDPADTGSARAIWQNAVISA